MMKPLCHTALAACLAALGTGLWSACTPSPRHSEFHTLPNSQWSRSDTLLFPLPPQEHDGEVTLTLDVRTAARFRYQTLEAEAALLDSNRVVARFPVVLQLYQDNRQPTGSGVHVVDNLTAPFRLPLWGQRPYSLRLTHRMAQSPLDDVVSIGVLVE